MGYDPCALKEIVFAKELMDKWEIGPNELQQYINNGLVAYYFAPGKKTKIKLESYSCGRIGASSNNLPQAQEDIDGFKDWVINWGCVVFNSEKVKEFEKENPQLVSTATSSNNLPSMGGYICFKEVEFADCIQRRWPGIEEWELAKHIDDKIENPQRVAFPAPYWMRKHKINPLTNDAVYFCERITTSHPYDEQHNNDNIWYDFSGIVFDIREALEWESDKEWLFFVDPGQLPRVRGGIATEKADESNVESAHNNFLTAEDIYRRWAVSPARLVEIIQSNEDLPVYWRQINVPF